MRTVDGDAFSDWLKEYGQEYIHGKKKISLMYIWKHVQDMPTITPERKRGRWIHYDEGDFDYDYKCSNCGYTVWDDSDFCPGCGAYMGGIQDE